jgi:hypothetical protein
MDPVVKEACDDRIGSALPRRRLVLVVTTDPHAGPHDIGTPTARAAGLAELEIVVDGIAAGVAVPHPGAGAIPSVTCNTPA